MEVQMVLLKSQIEKKAEQKEKSSVLTSRQLNFTRDDAKPICQKYWNKKYASKKAEILFHINKKFENVKRQKEKTDAKYVIFVKFFEDYKKEQDDIFKPEESLF